MVRSFIESVCSFQFLKFSAVGLMNSAIDFAVLNLLSYITGIYGGPGIAALNAVAFSVAVANSYFWNKSWTFRSGASGKPDAFSKFFILNACGAGLNSGIVYAITTFIAPVGGLHPQIWLNVAKIAALPVSTLWNFLGAKHFIFRTTRSRAVSSEGTAET